MDSTLLSYVEKYAKFDDTNPKGFSSVNLDSNLMTLTSWPWAEDQCSNIIDRYTNLSLLLWLE